MDSKLNTVVCNKCNETFESSLWQAEHADLVICDDCLAKEREAERQKEKEQEEKDRESKRIYYINRPEIVAKNCKIGKRYERARLIDFDINSEMLTKIKEWVKSKPEGFLLIQGDNPGNGKTHLACAILHYFAVAHFEFGLFKSAVDILLALRGTFDSASKDTEEYLMETWIKTPLLVIDDLGTEKSSEYAVQSFYQIINTRYNNLMPTIITTNCSSADLIDKLGARLFSRISSGIVIVLSGEDQRVKERAVIK